MHRLTRPQMGRFIRREAGAWLDAVLSHRAIDGPAEIDLNDPGGVVTVITQ